MEVASGVFAVVSLGIQLAESVQKIRRFLRDVKEAPEELQRLIRKIDSLYDIFTDVNALIERQRDMSSHHGLIRALESCAMSVGRLESELAHVQGAIDSSKQSWSDRPNGTSKNPPKGSPWKRQALRSVMNKETVNGLCSIVDESIQQLNLVLSLNSNQYLLGIIDMLRAMERPEHPIQALIKERTAESSTSNEVEHTLEISAQKAQKSNGLSMIGNRSATSKSIRRANCTRMWGYVQYREEVEYKCHGSEEQEQITLQRWSTVATLPFLRTFVEWQLLRSYGKVSRSLRYCPRVAETSLYLYLDSFLGFGLQKDALQDALNRREISPFAVDDEGRTLLHYAAICSNPDLCSLLIRLGVSPEQTDVEGRMPFLYFARHAETSEDFPTRASETVRILMGSQFDVGEADVQAFYSSYKGSPEVAELVFSYDKSLSEVDDYRNFQITPLHVALACLGRYHENPLGTTPDPEKWLYLVRKLLRGTVDLHARCESLSCKIGGLSFLGSISPLECILLGSYHPCDGEYAAKTWLALLHEAGYDQKAYLTQEALLHAQDEFTFFEPWHQLPAGTRCFDIDSSIPAKVMLINLDPPRVWWDWYIEPEYEAYHVLHEFRNFNIHSYAPLLVEAWSESWPFAYPDWFEESRPWYDARRLTAWEQRTKPARARHARRAERGSRKLSRSQRRRALNLPGAWIE